MRYFGKVGVEITVTREDDPTVDIETPVERPYYGDVLSANRRLESSSNGVNDNLTISNRISIVADAFAEQNFSVFLDQHDIRVFICDADF